jgi:NTP pyrophosphatase (non-canonical NTP hydrolase)
MQFSDYQDQLKALDHERGWDRVLPSHTFVHMGEELGEIARLLECLEGYRGTQLTRKALCQELAGELADLTAFVFKLASQHGIDMGQAMQDQLDKFMCRYQDVAQGQQEMARYVTYQERNLSWIKGEQDL